jgi:predicted signal transduction protein with EAL and GGDEF domain
MHAIILLLLSKKITYLLIIINGSIVAQRILKVIKNINRSCKLIIVELFLLDRQIVDMLRSQLPKDQRTIATTNDKDENHRFVKLHALAN